MTFAAAYILVDFFAENEDVRTDSNPHWQVQGGDYFMESIGKARRVGWEQTNREDVLEPRARLEGTPAPVKITPAVGVRCPALDVDGGQCRKDTDHDGAHISRDYAWPRVA